MKKLRLPTLLLLSTGLCAQIHSQVPGKAQDSSDAELVKVYVKQDPATYKKSTHGDELELEYAVQLSASSRPITDKNSLKSWEEIGPVYIHEENGMYKVRIGPFDSQDKAKQVLLQVKERGKKDAFISVQKGLEHYTPEGYARNPVFEEESIKAEPITPVKPENAPVAVQPSKVETNDTPQVTDDAMVEYKVRLASYLKPGGFNTKDVDQYGPLESYRKGDLTIMMIGGFSNEKDAMRVRDSVIAKGYKDASVVVVRDGILQLED
jgi:hypothetical protein